MDTPASLAAELLRASIAGITVSRAVVRKGALNVKNGAKRNVAASAPVHNAGAARAITYGAKLNGDNYEAEIGYDKNIAGGSLGNLLEYGSAKNAPHRDLGRALDAEEPVFVAELAAAIARLI